MTALFFDLETSDRNTIGQIINYSFIEVDGSFAPRSELSGLIKISRLQLPSPDAILANRTDVERHQQDAVDREREAMRKIFEYIKGVIERTRGPVSLIGYNSNRFDIPYLRTSLIRNGFNPYFGGKLNGRDLLQLVRKLSACHPDFPRPNEPDEQGKARLSLTLQSVARAFGLLEGVQRHESREDVLLTIRVAEHCARIFGGDVRSFEAYEVSGITERGTIRWMRTPCYETDGTGRHISTPYALLDADHRSSLWINLERFAAGEGRASISWYGRSTGAFVVDRESPQVTPEQRELAQKALLEYSTLTLKNFFSASSCDIEQDIYRLDFDGIEALRAALWDRNTIPMSKLKEPREVRVLYLRHALAHYEWGSGKDEEVERKLRAYALYRYGGELQLVKQLPSPGEQIRSATHHDTWQALTSRIAALLSERNDGADQQLLRALMRFYESSDIARVARAEFDSGSAGVSAVS